MVKRMCWLAFCWLLGGCYDKNSIDSGINYKPSATNVVITTVRSATKTAPPPPPTTTTTTTTRTPMTTKVASYHWPDPNAYTTRWDKVDMDQMLRSKRLMQHYFNCLLNKGPCPPDGMELKRAIPEALATGCAKCSKSQMQGAVKVIHHLREFEPVKFEMLANKYDPKGFYRKKYLEPSPEETSNSLNDEQSIDDRRFKRFVEWRR